MLLIFIIKTMLFKKNAGLKPRITYLYINLISGNTAQAAF